MKLSTLRLIYQVSACSSKDETRLHLNSVCLEKDKVIATDGHKLVSRHLKDETIDYLFESQDQFLISTEKEYKNRLKHFLANNKNLDGSLDLHVTIHKSHIAIGTEINCVVLKLIEREYIKYQAVIPADLGKFNRIRINIDYLSSLVESLKERGDDLVLFVPKDMPDGYTNVIAVKQDCSSSDIGVVMPMKLG